MTSLNECEWIDMKIKDEDINYFEYNEFSNVETAGEGAFGIVTKADWKNGGIKIALKRIRANNPSINKNNMNKFLKEVKLKNIITFDFNLILIIFIFIET